MEQVSVPLSEKTIVPHPFTKEKNRLPLTKEAILSLNDGTVSFEEARALFNVDLLTFQAMLEKFNIFVWNDVDGPLRIHGGDYELKVVVKQDFHVDRDPVYHFFTRSGLSSFESVRHSIEYGCNLSPGCYKLTFKHPNQLDGIVSVKTDRDWHFVVLFSKLRANFVYLDLEVFPSRQTADEVACDENPLYEHHSLSSQLLYAGRLYVEDCDEGSSNEDAYSEDAYDVSWDKFVEDASDEFVLVCVDRQISMEQVSVPLSEKLILSHPFTNEKNRLPLTKAILSLNDGTVSFEEARALFNVNLFTFQAMLEKLNIFVWKESDGSLLRIHGGDYAFQVVIKDMRVKAKYYYNVSSTLSFEAVRSMIEEDLKVSPGCYKLTFQHPMTSIWNFGVQTDRDWHEAVSSSLNSSYSVYLDLEDFPSSQTGNEDACDEPFIVFDE